MYRRKPKSWTSIVEFYRELVEQHHLPLRPMLELVKRISESPYANGLLPDTSMYTLYLAQSESGLTDFPRLRIESDPEHDRLLFTYEDSYNDKTLWRREVESDEGFPVFERFLLKRARWFKIAG